MLQVIASYSKPGKWFVGTVEVSPVGRRFKRYLPMYFDTREQAVQALNIVKEQIKC